MGRVPPWTSTGETGVTGEGEGLRGRTDLILHEWLTVMQW
jgi:hypothetical protein